MSEIFHHKGVKVSSKSTVIAETECGACGKDVKVYLDKNMRAYARCNWPDNDTLQTCGRRIHFSAAETIAMLDAYSAARRPARKDCQNGDETPGGAPDNPPAKADQLDTGKRHRPESYGGLFGS